MKYSEHRSNSDLQQTGQAMYRFASDLYPICRSITGNGFRETLDHIRRHIPLEQHEVPSGTAVFDWTVPKEWNIREAYIQTLDGKRIVSFSDSNLHVVNYSVPIRARMSFAELSTHLHTLPEQPDWIPYRTSYYNEDWGFCLPHRTLLEMTDDAYDVCIESSLEAGHLSYGEYFVPGESDDEILVSCHACHPSLANDNLSGIAVATFLAGIVARQPRRYSYRFVFIPGTIGSITWLALNEHRAGLIKHGMVLTGVGDAGPLTYKKSRRGDADIDRAFAQVLRHSGADYEIMDFVPYGYDERQYCSPGFDLPVGCLMRTPHGRYAEYHTSADDLSFIRADALADTLLKCLGVLNILEHDRRYLNTNPKCEPQLGKRGLYKAIGGQRDAQAFQMALLWVLNQSDGTRSLLRIAETSGLDFETIENAATTLREHGLLVEPGAEAEHALDAALAGSSATIARP